MSYPLEYDPSYDEFIADEELHAYAEWWFTNTPMYEEAVAHWMFDEEEKFTGKTEWQYRLSEDYKEDAYRWLLIHRKERDHE